MTGNSIVLKKKREVTTKVWDQHDPTRNGKLVSVVLDLRNIGKRYEFEAVNC